MENAIFTVDQKKLSTVLGSMQAICAKRTTLDVTSAILFQAGRNELVIKSTDLELSLQYSCLLSSGSTTDQVTFLVPGRRVFELTKELEGDINVSVQENQVALNAGSAQLLLNVKDVAEFPPFPERIENLMDLKTVDLVAMIEKVAFVAPQNNANPALNGVLFEIDADGMKLTATDGHCLAQVTTNAYTLDKPRKWLLPRRAIFELKKILDTGDDQKIFLGLCGNQLVFSGESFNLFTKLLVDAFPDYQQILAKEDFVKRVINKEALVKSLRRASCLLSGQFIATEFNFNDQLLEIAMNNKEVGKLKESISLLEFVEGELSIRFYAPYLLAGLQALPGVTATCWLSSKMRPIIFVAEQERYSMSYLVMPVSPIDAG